MFAADSYIILLAPLHGKLKSITDCQTLYRIHSRNNSARVSFNRRLSMWENWFTTAQEFLLKQGIQADLENWRRNPRLKWTQLMVRVGEELSPFIPSGTDYILVDMNQFGTGELLEDSRSIPFLEKDGVYWGPPDDDNTAIQDLDRLRQVGASFIVFGWPAFWWFDHYSEFNRHLRSKFRCVAENDYFVVFDLW